MFSIIRGSTQKPVSAQRLTDFFRTRPNHDGLLYVGYPIVGTADGSFTIDALLVTRDEGMIVINLVEGTQIDNAAETQDDSANKLEAKLRSHKGLMKGRELDVPLRTVTFAPAVRDVPNADADHAVCNEGNFESWLAHGIEGDFVNFEALLAVLQSISTIRRGLRKRDARIEDSRGAKLKRLEDSIANLDNIQGHAVIETVDGVQRIRGLAGSGKTIVLALKAAYLHAQHPEWKIAVTFHTRSLKEQFRRLINTFTIEQTNEEPDWDNLHILHSWGAPGGGQRNGMYYSFCKANNVEYQTLSDAKRKYSSGSEFSGICSEALSAVKDFNEFYDAILIDEAQDFDPAFLQLCFAFLKAPKRLVYAYDELQNLKAESLPSPEAIFGTDPQGRPKVTLEADREGMPRQDVILRKCYRNSRPILATAHALGFGIYRTPDPTTGTGLVQIFDQTQLWIDVGYEVVEGELEDGHDVTLARTIESSPKFLEEHSALDDLVQFHCFNDVEDQSRWLTAAIATNLREEELRPDDILVINPDPIKTERSFSLIRKSLFDIGINTHLAGVDTSPDIFFDLDNESIAFTGIHRAKGNEAGMVYIINAQDCYASFGNISAIRNRLFTAITRSKAWVRVLGIGKGMQDLKQEFEAVRSNDYSLSFCYPTRQERERINIVNRDLSNEERKRVSRGKTEIQRVIEELETGKVHPLDLGPELLNRLRAVLDDAE